MKPEKNYNITLRAVPHFSPYQSIPTFYILEYQIDPEQLKWYEKILYCGWHNIDDCVFGSIQMLIINNKKDFPKYKEKFKTLQDIKEYESQEYQERNDFLKWKSDQEQIIY